MEPRIVVDDYSGIHNSGNSAERVRKAGHYKNQSTICLIPTRGVISYRVVQSWWNMASPMNQQFVRMFVSGYEVGAAYSNAIEQILATPGLNEFQFILTLEEDNMPPPDGLLKLLARMEEHPELDAIGGLYWTKGEAGEPMIYGDPNEMPMSFRPQPPVEGQLVSCNGLGMGFTLFRVDLFRDERIARPWFETVQRYGPDGQACYTQDLFFFEKALSVGHKFAADCNVHVGHFDLPNDTIW